MWQEVLKAEAFPRPLQYPPKEIARQLRADMNASKFHKGMNTFIPLLGIYALRDKARASEYNRIAKELKRITLEVRKLITDYENKEG